MKILNLMRTVHFLLNLWWRWDTWQGALNARSHCGFLAVQSWSRRVTWIWTLSQVGTGSSYDKLCIRSAHLSSQLEELGSELHRFFVIFLSILGHGGKESSANSVLFLVYQTSQDSQAWNCHEYIRITRLNHFPKLFILFSRVFDCITQLTQLL